MLSYAIETLSVMRTQEAGKLLKLHWHELAEEKTVFKLDPDWPVYEAAEQNGSLLVVTARIDETLVGYVIAFVRAHPHYKAAVCGFEDLHFLRPDQRGHGAGRAMILYAMDAMRAKGAVMVFIHGKIGHDTGSHLSAIGFRPMDYIFVRRL